VRQLVIKVLKVYSVFVETEQTLTQSVYVKSISLHSFTHITF